MYWRDSLTYKDFGASLDNVKAGIDSINQQYQRVGKKLCLQVTDRCFPEEFAGQSKKVLVTNNFLQPGVLDPELYEQLPASWYHLYYLLFKDDYVEVPIEKSFNCFIGRMDPVRQSWLYQLVRRNIFDQGYVSFRMDLTRHIQNGICDVVTDPRQVFEDQFQQYCQIFQAEHDAIKSRVPYRNFDDSQGLEAIVMRSKFSIILETYFDDTDPVTFSEKIFRGLLFPRPWILFSTKGAVDYLRTAKFDVLDDVVDHSYDQLDGFVSRQTALLDQAQVLCELDVTENLQKRFEQAAQHNRQLLKECHDNWPKDFEISMKNAVKKLEAL